MNVKFWFSLLYNDFYTIMNTFVNTSWLHINLELTLIHMAKNLWIQRFLGYVAQHFFYIWIHIIWKQFFSKQKYWVQMYLKLGDPLDPLCLKKLIPTSSLWHIQQCFCKLSQASINSNYFMQCAYTTDHKSKISTDVSCMEINRLN